MPETVASNKKNRGLLITFEGPEGSGKTTQIKLLQQYFENRGSQVITTREPGGTVAGDKIRHVLLDKENGHLEPETELFLMLAQRTEHLKKVIEPAVSSGKIVLCDRYYDSSMAYQGYGRGLPTELITQTHTGFLGGFLPDFTILLLIEPQQGLERARHGGSKQLDRMESQDLEFHQRVFQGYKKMAELEPDRFIAIAASGDASSISQKIQNELSKRFTRR